MDKYKQIQQIVVLAIEKKFDFLFNLGYLINIEYDGENRYTEFKKLIITYSNSKTLRVVVIDFNRYLRDNNVIDDFISFKIINKENDPFYNGFSLFTYMKFIQKNEFRFERLNSFEGSFEEKLNQLLDYVGDILQTYLIPVLKGEEWINVPMDWHGAR